MISALDDTPRAAMPVGVTGALRALGHRFCVSSNADGLAECLDAVLRPLAAPTERPDHLYEVLVLAEGEVQVSMDGFPIATCGEVPLALEWLLWHVNQSAAASVAGQVALHAGGVQAGHVGILLPGPSGAGKSSLVAALVECGLGYLSDELLVIEDHGDTVVGYPKPIALRPGALQALPRWRPRPGREAGAPPGTTVLVDPERVVPGCTGRACRPAIVVAPRFTPTAGASLTALSAPEGLLDLVGNSVRFGSPDPDHVRVLARVARRCRCYRLDFGSLDEASRIILDLVRRP